jgi:anti-sigma B factor antagonist
MGTEFSIELEQKGGRVCVRVSGELDLATVPSLYERLRVDGAEGAAHADRVLLDLSGVTFIDSTGLRAVLDLHEQFGERLRIRPGDVTTRLLTLAGAADRLPLVGTDDD